MPILPEIPEIYNLSREVLEERYRHSLTRNTMDANEIKRLNKYLTELEAKLIPNGNS